MSKPKREIKTRNYNLRLDDFFSAIAERGNNFKQIENLFNDLLTESEIRMLKRRWFVASLINDGKTIREAAEEAEVGTDTVVRVIKKIKNGSGVLKEILIQKMRKVPEKKRVFDRPKRVKTVKWFFGVK
jgi:uncharacterized protein YerC